MPPRLPQASAVPYRFRSGAPEYLLITSLKGNWIFPKGIIDPGETPQETALKEAYEEAGVRGRIAGGPLGSYRYEKWGYRCEVEVFLMEVEREELSWPERGERERSWFPFPEAQAMMKSKKLKEVLARAREALSREGMEGGRASTRPGSGG